jgi:primosomal protein N' (replication factor Y)
VYADVSLPVPLDQPFTYVLPETLRHRVQAGSRVLVPFGSRKLTGVVLQTHTEAPAGTVREVLRLLDETPVFEPHMMELARWVATYYCAPLGEVLRVMAPLTGEIRASRVYTLTDAGRDVVRRLLPGIGDDEATIRIMRMVEHRPRSSTYLAKKVPDAARALRALANRGWVEMEDVKTDRDPLRGSSARLKVAAVATRPEVKLRKPERELLSYLELHPGAHNLGELSDSVKGASEAARALARKKLVTSRGSSAGRRRNALRRIRARAEPGPHHRRRGARPKLQTAGHAQVSRA